LKANAFKDFGEEVRLDGEKRMNQGLRVFGRGKTTESFHKVGNTFSNRQWLRMYRKGSRQCEIVSKNMRLDKSKAEVSLIFF